MDVDQKDYIISRIQAGIINISLFDREYLCKEPPAFVKLRANILYNESSKEIDRFGLLTKGDLNKLLIKKKLWTQDLEDELKTLGENIEKLKIGIYESRYNNNERNKARKALKLTKDRQSDLLLHRHMLDHWSAEHAKSLCRQYYLLYFSLCSPEGKFIHQDITNQNFALEHIDALVDLFYGAIYNESIYREIARTDPWLSLWYHAEQEKGLFGVMPTEYNIEQRIISSWSRWYSSVFQAHDRPEQGVIDDDDSLDGWAIMRKKNMEKEDKQRRAEEIVQKHGLQNKSEIYLMATTEEEANDINDLNSPVGKMIKAQRDAALKAAGGSISEVNMPDTKIKLLNMMSEKLKERQ